ncbi:MAG: acyl-CoA dehydrogenase family protein, partial [Actinobacteria bacterium]|nr:acyl-CoA dehydrogenase family protein [Actinomycetota bacterium]
MAIDFTLSPELEEIRLRVRSFVNDVVKPGEAELDKLRDEDRADYIGKL